MKDQAAMCWRIALTAILLASGFLLSSCDAWPTIIDNRSPHNIRFQYHQRDYDYWSGLYDLKSGEAQRLDREHWVQDVLGLKVIDNGRIYHFDYAALAPIRNACASWDLSRRMKFTPDCYVTYDGDGRFVASFKEPNNLKFAAIGKSGI